VSLDQTTESIAHFIGLFQMAVEELRLRDDYIEFKFEKAKEIEAEPSEFVPVQFAAPLRLSDYSPHSRYAPEQEVRQPAEIAGLPDIPVPFQGYSGAPFFAPPLPPGPVIPGDGGGFLLPYVPIPASVITITLQSIFLYDNDVLGDVVGAGFVSSTVLLSVLQTVAELAEALQPWTTEGLAAAVLGDPDAAIDFIDTLSKIDVNDMPGLETVIFQAEDAEGFYVNGEQVEELPELEDFLPQFIRAKRDDDSDEAEDTDTPLAGASKDDVGLLNTQEGFFKTFADSGHSVISGANESHNVVDLHTSWIDAAVIAVAGDVVQLNAISQLNILSDQDFKSGQSFGNDQMASQSANVASMDLQKIADDALEEGAPATTPLSGLPSVWNLVTFEGDVTVTNLVEQHVFAMDSDQLNLTFTANSTIITAGENLMFNEASAGEFGFGYDLVFVGGSMVSMNIIQQTNVLLDDDYYSGDGLGLASISGNDNSLLNMAEITQYGHDEKKDMLKEFKDALKDLSTGAADLAQEVAQSDLFLGFESLRVLFIEGNLTQMNIVDQINYLGDSDQIHMALDAMQSVVDVMPVAITAGSNMLTNTASILQEGFDSVIMAEGEYYTEAILYQADLIDTDADPAGVTMSGLANEAVAFLADDMTSEPVASALGADGHATDLHSSGTTFDVMQTLTA
jgi:hypothetical protein